MYCYPFPVICRANLSLVGTLSGQELFVSFVDTDSKINGFAFPHWPTSPGGSGGNTTLVLLFRIQQVNMDGLLGFDGAHQYNTKASCVRMCIYIQVRHILFWVCRFFQAVAFASEFWLHVPFVRNSKLLGERE